MLATQAPVNHSLHSSLHAVKSDVRDILHSGQYYVTDELARRMYDINNGMDHIKFDQNLLNTSKEWRAGFDPARLHQEQTNATQAMHNAQGALFDYKSQMSGKNMDGKQENQVRESHHWADGTLAATQQDLYPYVVNAHNRIQQFSDHIGVTDQYTGYRHNLTRGSREPLVLGLSWLDTKKNALNSSLNTGFRATHPTAGTQVTFGQLPRGVHTGTMSDTKAPDAKYLQQTYMGGNKSLQGRLGTTKFTERQTGGTMDRLQAYKTTMHTKNGPNTQSIQEACGINMTFPGKTEYMTRYKKPPTDERVSAFIINPAPDFSIHKRPLMSAKIDPSFTEYQTRYEWPDAGKIVKLPWLRK